MTRERFNRRTQQKKDAVLPPPEVFERYEKILPGSSGELISLVKTEQEHRHKLQRGYLMSYRLGQLTGFVFNLYFITIIAKLYKYMPSGSLVPHVLLGAYLLIFIASLLDTRSDRKAVSLKIIKSLGKAGDKNWYNNRKRQPFKRDKSRRDGRSQNYSQRSRR
ncbi:DUF2335 domain-containing protein [Pseudomonadota bacterium]